MHDELLGNWWLHSGVTANVHNPGVSIDAAAVGLYCAVVDRFDVLVSTRTIAARESQVAFNQRAKRLRTWLGALNLGLVECRQREREERPFAGCAPAHGVRRGLRPLWRLQISTFSIRCGSTSAGHREALGVAAAKVML